MNESKPTGGSTGAQGGEGNSSKSSAGNSSELSIAGNGEQKLRIIVDNQRGGRSGWWGRLLTIGLMLSVMFNFALYSAYSKYMQPSEGPQERFHSGSKTAKKKIAILEVDVTIIPPYTERLLKAIERAAEDDSVIGTVLVVDSPGGLVADSHQIYRELQKLAEKKPMFVQMKRLAASGGYYVAMAAGENGRIYAEPTTWTGSIGVIIPRYDMTEAAEKVGVRSEPLTTGEFKDSLSSFKPLSDREREVWEGIINEAYDRFLTVIEGGRPKLNRTQIEATATGRIFTADQAKAEGLVDEIGYLDETIEALKKQLGEEQIRVVEYSQPPNLVDLLLGATHGASELSLLKQLLETPRPQAFYLMGTGLPRAWQ